MNKIQTCCDCGEKYEDYYSGVCYETECSYCGSWNNKDYRKSKISKEDLNIIIGKIMQVVGEDRNIVLSDKILKKYLVKTTFMEKGLSPFDFINEDPKNNIKLVLKDIKEKFVS